MASFTYVYLEDLDKLFCDWLLAWSSSETAISQVSLTQRCTLVSLGPWLATLNFTASELALAWAFLCQEPGSWLPLNSRHLGVLLPVSHLTHWLLACFHFLTSELVLVPLTFQALTLGIWQTLLAPTFALANYPPPPTSCSIKYDHSFLNTNCLLFTLNSTRCLPMVSNLMKAEAKRSYLTKIMKAKRGLF